MKKRTQIKEGKRKDKHGRETKRKKSRGHDKTRSRNESRRM